jgi:acyl carrier protein
MSTAPVVLDEVISVIRNSVNLHHMGAERFTPETSLREGGLELDSVDILEVIVAVEHHFKVKVDDAEMGKRYFRTIGTITELITNQNNKQLAN